GIALIIAALVAIGLSPENVQVDSFGANSLSPGPRVNFAPTIGIALGLPALFVLVVEWCWNYMKLVQYYPRHVRVFGLASLTCLIYVGFIGLPAYGNVFSHRSVVPTLFARYSLFYGLLIIAYVFVMVLVTGTVLLSSVSYTRNALWRRVVNQIEPAVPRIRAHFFSGIVGCMVLAGTLFHFSMKEEFADEWRRHKAMLEQLHSIAPAIEDDTFVIIVYDQPRRSLSMPYMTQTELSCYLLALYNNWSIIGTSNRHIRFYPDGVQARYYNSVAMWLPLGVKGPVNLYTPQPVPRISYDRILLFAFDGTTLRMLPGMEVKMEGDGHRVVESNPERILNQTSL